MQRYNINNRLAYLSGGVQSAGGMWPSLGSGIGTTGLVSWWTMDETSGTRFDSHGSNDLAVSGTDAYTTGVVGNAYSSGSGSNYLSIASNTTLNPSGSFAIAGWVQAGVLVAERYIAKWDYGNNNRQYAIALTPSTLQFQVDDNGSSPFTTRTASSFGSLSTGTWYFVVAWYDHSGSTINIQVNNGTVDSTAFTGPVYAGSAPLKFGAMTSNGGDEGAVGSPKVDEFSLWSRVLTSDERTWLYNSGAGRTYTDL